MRARSPKNSDEPDIEQRLEISDPSMLVDRATAPRVSVIITCYNLGRYLDESIESVLNQTLPAVELIVVDDGSTEQGTRLAVDAATQRGIHVIRQNNQGVGAARNRGIQEARGAYICCLDADDRLRPQFLEKAAAILDKHPEIAIVSSYVQTFEGAHEIAQPSQCRLPEMLFKNPIVASALFRRDAWQKAGGYAKLGVIEDWDLWISILEQGYRIHVIPEILFDYRIRPDSRRATTWQPETYGKLLATLARRHRVTYQEHWVAFVEGIGAELAESSQYFREQERANTWLEEERRKWQVEAERQAALVTELRAWIEELEKGKTWLEEQRAHWQAEAERLNATIAEQQALIAELEKEA